MSRMLVTIAVLGVCAVVAQGQTINHNHVDAATTLPQSTIDAIAQQKWLFTHASVGGNMIEGMNSLHDADPARYPLVAVAVGSGDSCADAPPSPTTAGTIYDCDRGNPGWEAKVTYLDESVRTAGWHNPAVTVVLNKMCYIDQDADAQTYLDSMAALEASYPGVPFVYATMPLTTSTDSENILRNQYNEAVRAYCTSHGSLLFDIADMEAHTPSGVEYLFNSVGQTYQRMYPGYSSDGGHLNAAGCERIALGWYATAGAIIAPPAETPGSTDSPSPPPSVAPSLGVCGSGVTGALATMTLGWMGLRLRRYRG